MRGFLNNRINDKHFQHGYFIQHCRCCIILFFFVHRNMVWCVLVRSPQKYTMIKIKLLELKVTWLWDRTEMYEVYVGLSKISEYRSIVLNMSIYHPLKTHTTWKSTLQVINTLVYFGVLCRDEIFLHFYKKSCSLIISNYRN